MVDNSEKLVATAGAGGADDAVCRLTDSLIEVTTGDGESDPSSTAPGRDDRPDALCLLPKGAATEGASKVAVEASNGRVWVEVHCRYVVEARRLVDTDEADEFGSARRWGGC